ncbi:MAG: hypothetical protein U0526_03360 [Candidatus Saccharibacteria bacterium]|jgi:hypothetical protein
MADQFTDACLAVCKAEGVKIDPATRDLVIAEVHTQLNLRMFRPERIVTLGGPPELPRTDRILWVTAFVMWKIGMRPNHPKFRQLTTGLRLREEAEASSQQPIPASIT